jgi:hypothetical protein
MSVNHGHNLRGEYHGVPHFTSPRARGIRDWVFSDLIAAASGFLAEFLRKRVEPVVMGPGLDGVLFDRGTLCPFSLEMWLRRFTMMVCVRERLVPFHGAWLMSANFLL